MVWTINDIETFKYLLSLMNGIITDRPRLLFETLKNIISIFLKYVMQ